MISNKSINPTSFVKQTELRAVLRNIPHQHKEIDDMLITYDKMSHKKQISMLKNSYTKQYKRKQANDKLYMQFTETFEYKQINIDDSLII